MKKTFAFMLFSFVLIIATYAQPKRININDRVSFSSLKSAAVVDQFDIAVKNARPFALNPMVWNHSNVAIGDTLQLALFTDKEYLSVVQSKTTDVNGTTVLVSKLTGFQFAWCFISITDQNVLVTIDIPEQREKYTTRLLPKNNSQYLVQLDENKLDILPDGQMQIETNSSIRQSFLPNNNHKSTEIGKENINLQHNIGLKSVQSAPGAGDSAQIDVLVVYTPAAKEWADTNEGGINNTISLAMTNCNLVSENSKLGIKFNMVHSTEVDYYETRNSTTDLNNLTEGLISNVHAIRDILAADLVLFIINTDDFGGMSYLLDNKGGKEEYGFSTVRVQQASGLATIHEIGHNLGAHHHKEQNYQPGPTIWSNWPENIWSAGWRWKGDDNNYYCDLMTYEPGSFYSDGITHTQIPYFSDPEFNFQGQLAGLAIEANNTRTIREMKNVVAAYRASQLNYLPTVYTISIHDINNDTSISGGNVTNEGESKVISKGIVWGPNRLPNLNGHFTVDGSGLGSFNSLITEMKVDSIYYVRAFATNSKGTAYGNQVVFVHTGGKQRDFITRWDLPSGQDKLEFLLNRSGEVNYKWETMPQEQSGSGIFSRGDGLVEIDNLPPGKTIRLYISPNNLKRFYSYVVCPITIDGPDRENIVDVEQWGTARWSGLQNAFFGCKNLNISATDIPQMNDVKDMSGMFRMCIKLNGPANINEWPVSSVTDMHQMFFEANEFNQNVGAWDLSNVKNMGSMFQKAISFNQDIGHWDVSNVKDMSNLFWRASAFNQDIGKWDVSKVTTMNSMFFGAKSFNQDIGRWNVSNVTDMLVLFGEADNFNQDIGKWDVANVTEMYGMFSQAYSFNQDIGTWNVSSVKGMANLFKMASVFNQNLGRWNMQSATSTDDMLYESGLDCFNYSSTLIGWCSNSNTPDSLILGAKNLQFGNSASEARLKFINDKKWTITGDAATGASCDLKTNFIGNKLSDSNLKLYPNPVTNELIIEIGDNPESYKFQIINAMGQTVYNGSVIDRMVVQTRSFAPGLYLLRFENNNSFEFKKIIKE